MSLIIPCLVEGCKWIVDDALEEAKAATRQHMAEAHDIPLLSATELRRDLEQLMRDQGYDVTLEPQEVK